MLQKLTQVSNKTKSNYLTTSLYTYVNDVHHIYKADLFNNSLHFD